MLLRALAEAADLRLRVLVGEDALDRAVAGVYTTDLLDPRRYLTGGEIVLTGLMWRRGPADSDPFVAALAKAGAVALAAGDAALGYIPDDLVAACRRHRMPLFEVPVDVSFAAITERVLAGRPRPGGPGPAVARLRLLAGGPAGAGRRPGEPASASLAEVFLVASREYGVTGWVISAAGRLVLGAPPAPGAPLRSALAVAWLGGDGMPATILADGAPYSLFGVPGQPQNRLACWFVALAGDQAAWDADRRAIAAELAAVTAGHWARTEVALRGGRRAADAALRRVLDRGATADGSGDQEIAAALRRCGLAAHGPVAAVALTAGALPAQAFPPAAGGPAFAPAAVPPFPGAAGPGFAGAAWPAVPPAVPPAAAGPEVARVLLEDMLSAPVVGVCGPEAVALAPVGGNAVDRVRDAAAALARVPGLDLALGVSVLPAGPGLPAGAVSGPAGTGPGPVGGPGAPGGPGLGSGTSGPGDTSIPEGIPVPLAIPLPPVPPGPAGPSAGPAGPSAAAGGLARAGPVQAGPVQQDANGPASGWTVAGIARAVAGARQAGRVAALLGGGARLVDAADLGSVGLLLATVPPESRRAFQASLLSPLVDYDRDHGTELVRTLRVFLDCSGSWTKAADTMFVHVNSLRYRIRRVEELTGRDLGSLPDQAALLLALRLHDAAGPDPGGDPGTGPADGGGFEAGQFGSG